MTRLPTRRHVERWFVPLGRGMGMWGYVLNRLAGLGLVVYLYLHLAILSLLSRGAGSWDSFVAVAKSPLVLALDVLLIAGVLVHGLYGLRLALVGFGFAVRAQKPLFVGLMAVAVVAVVASVLKIYGVV